MMIHIYLVVLISEDDVISGIKQLKSTKIYGSDTIQNDHLIFRGPKLVICLTIYLNYVIGKTHIPKKWHNEHVCPLYKSADTPRSHPDSYRPLCTRILSSLLKVFEKSILIRIQTFELRPGTFPNPLQHNFPKQLLVF